MAEIEPTIFCSVGGYNDHYIHHAARQGSYRILNNFKIYLSYGLFHNKCDQDMDRMFKESCSSLCGAMAIASAQEQNILVCIPPRYKHFKENTTMLLLLN
jgi:hypothetical protein